MRQCAPHLTYLSIFSFSLLADYLNILMLECVHFSHITGSLHYDGWMMLQLGCCHSVLLLSVLVVCKHWFCNVLHGQPFFVLLCCMQTFLPYKLPSTFQIFSTTITCPATSFSPWPSWKCTTCLHSSIQNEPEVHSNIYHFLNTVYICTFTILQEKKWWPLFQRKIYLQIHSCT